MRAATNDIGPLAELGVAQEVLDRDGCIEAAPGLSRVADPVSERWPDIDVGGLTLARYD